MDTKQAEQLASLGAAGLAHGLVLKALLQLAVPDRTTRNALREKLCEAVERLYETGRVIDHDGLQRVLVEIEAVFDRPQKPSG